MSEFEGMIPPATFDFLIGSFAMQAQVHMGIIRIPGEEELRLNLPLAKHAIDMLGVIEAKTKGNLELEEQRMLGNALTELRFRFVQTSSAQATSIPSDSTPGEDQ